MTVFRGMKPTKCACQTMETKENTMIRTTLIAIALFTAPMAAIASGANTKTGIGDKNGPLCAPGFYWDASDELCIAANWI